MWQDLSDVSCTRSETLFPSVRQQVTNEEGRITFLTFFPSALISLDATLKADASLLSATASRLCIRVTLFLPLAPTRISHLSPKPVYTFIPPTVDLNAAQTKQPNLGTVFSAQGHQLCTPGPPSSCHSAAEKVHSPPNVHLPWPSSRLHPSSIAPVFIIVLLSPLPHLHLL